jgi:electron transfer flavoprotein beta subunit
MRIAVCVKQVPHRMRCGWILSTNTIIRDGNNRHQPYDRFALELALQIKERLGGSVVVGEHGHSGNGSDTKRALSCGADEAVLLR